MSMILGAPSHAPEPRLRKRPSSWPQRVTEEMPDRRGLWYFPHTHTHTRRQAPEGLASGFQASANLRITATIGVITVRVLDLAKPSCAKGHGNVRCIRQRWPSPTDRTKPHRSCVVGDHEPMLRAYLRYQPRTPHHRHSPIHGA